MHPAGTLQTQPAAIGGCCAKVARSTPVYAAPRDVVMWRNRDLAFAGL